MQPKNGKQIAMSGNEIAGLDQLLNKNTIGG